MRAIDTSRYATGNKEIPQAAFTELRARGIELFIPGAWHGFQGYDQVALSLANARAAGMKTAAYIALSPTSAGAWAVSRGKELVGAREWGELSFVAVDVESEGLRVAQVHDAIASVKILGQRPVIYTANWFWKGHFGNPTDFSDIPLWNAYYDNDPDYDFGKAPFGGWSLSGLAGEQYTNTTSVKAGGFTFSVDYNEFSSDFVNKKVPATGFAEAMAALRDAWGEDMEKLSASAEDLTRTPFETLRLAFYSLHVAERDRAWKRLLGK